MNKLAIFAVAWDEIIKIVVILLVVFGSAIGKIIASIREANRTKAPQRPPVMQQQQPQVQPQAARPKTVKEEIDDFLQRAAQKKQSQASRPATSSFERREEPGVPTRRITPEPSSSRSQSNKPIQAEIVQDRPVGGEVSAHVNKYLDEKEFAQRASKMGGEVAESDARIAHHMQEVFGHGISQLASQPGETATAPTSKSTGFFEDEVPILSAAGTGLASLLNNIDNLRQAIVVNEILQRPVDRWK